MRPQPTRGKRFRKDSSIRLVLCGGLTLLLVSLLLIGRTANTAVVPNDPLREARPPYRHQFEPLTDSSVCWCPAYDMAAAWDIALLWDIEHWGENAPLTDKASLGFGSGVQIAYNNDVSDTRAVRMHVYRGPCDTYHRQMKEYILQDGDVRHVGYLRGRFETCAAHIQSPRSPLPFSEQRDIRADIIPSCTDRKEVLSSEVTDYWESVRTSARIDPKSFLERTSEPCQCDGQLGFQLAASVSDKRLDSLNARLVSLFSNISAVCGRNDAACLSKQMATHARMLVENALSARVGSAESSQSPETSNHRVIPTAPAVFDLTLVASTAHPSRDALCRAAVAQMEENPSIELLPAEEVLPEGVLGEQTKVEWHFPSFDAAAIQSFSPLVSLRRIVEGGASVQWPQLWKTYSRCGECQETIVDLGDLTDEEMSRKERVETALSMLELRDFSIPSIRKAIGSSRISLMDLRWYGRRVALGSLAEKSVSASFETSAAATLMLPSMGPGGRSLIAQAELFERHSLVVDENVLRQDNADRNIGAMLYAKIANKKRRALQQSVAGNGLLRNLLGVEGPPSQKASRKSVKVNLLAVQLGAIGSALEFEGGASPENSPSPFVTSSILGPLLAPSTAVAQLPKVPSANAFNDALEQYSLDKHRYATLTTPMRRDEVAMDFCLARFDKTAARKATGGDASVPSIRRSLLVNTINGAPLVCYDGNDVVCDTVKSQGVWETHLHSLLRAITLRIRSEVRLAATIIKERESVLKSRGVSLEAMLKEEASLGPMRAWHPAASAFESNYERSSEGLATLGKALLDESPTSPPAYDRFAYFLRPTRESHPVSIAKSTDTLNHLTRVPAQQLQFISYSEDSTDSFPKKQQRQQSASFLIEWSRASHAFHLKNGMNVSSSLLPEVFDRRIDVEFVTEDMMNSLKHLSRMKPPQKSAGDNADAANGLAFAERPLIPQLLLPAKNFLRVRGNRNEYDDDVLFMDAGANVGSFSFDLRLGGSVRSAAPGAYTQSFDDASFHTGSVIDGSAATNVMLLEALPANVFLLETTQCLNTVREYSTWRLAFHNIVNLFDGLTCFENGVEVCTTKTHMETPQSVSDWSDIPSYVTREGFSLDAQITSVSKSSVGSRLALENHHQLLNSYLSSISTCTMTTQEDEHVRTSIIRCQPPSWQPTLHHVALGDRDSQGGDVWCVLTSDFGNLADTLLTCDPSEVRQARALADELAAKGVPIGHPRAFEVIPPSSQIRGRLLPSSFVQLTTLDAVIRNRAMRNVDENAEMAVRTLLTPRGVPASLVNGAMARRFSNLIADVEKVLGPLQPAATVQRPSRASSLAELLAYVCTQKPFLKMDVEGFEPFVLKGLSKTIENPSTRPLVVLTESWRSTELVTQGKRMINEFNYVGITVEVESWHAGKRTMHLLTTEEDVVELNDRLLGTDMNTIVWVQKGYEDFLPQLSVAHRASTGRKS